jgi:hypothetical protein
MRPDSGVDCVAAGGSPAQLCGLKDRFGLSPQPPIFGRVFHQVCSNRIVQQVCHPVRKAFIAPEHMIKGLVLPNLAFPFESFIYPVSRLALDGMHDLWNRKRTVFVGKRREDQVDVVRHHYGRVQNAFLAVDMDAGFESEVTGKIGEMPALVGSECNEEGFIVFLHVGQVAASVVVPSLHG